MVLRDWFKAETWRLGWQLRQVVMVTSAAYFILLTTTWWSLGVCGALLAMFAYIARSGPASSGASSSAPPSVRRTLGQTFGQTLPPSLSQLPAWLLSGLALTLYIAVSAAWSADPRATAVTALLLGVLLTGCHAGAVLIGRCPPPSRHGYPGDGYLEHITRTMMVVFAAAALFLLAELLTGDAVKKFLFWPFRAFKWSSFTFDRTTVVHLSVDNIKWRMPAVNFTVWTVMFVAALHFGFKRSYVWQAAILVLVACLNWASAHGASRAALLAAVLAFPFALYSPAAARRGLAALWVLAFVAVVPAAQAFYRAELHTDRRIKQTMNARFIIWAYTAEHVKDRPLAGNGAAATGLINNRLIAAGLAGKKTPDAPYSWSPGPHAHNIFLQSWYELGALGAALLCIFGLAVLRLTASAPARAQPYLLTSFVTVCVTGSASFGLFEPWFMGAFALCAMSAVIALAYGRAVEAGEG